VWHRRVLLNEMINVFNPTDNLNNSQRAPLEVVRTCRVTEISNPEGPEAEQGFITSSPRVLRILEIARHVAETDVPVLILGESGVGKDVLARYIHRSSNRTGRPFVRVNCAALPAELLESELFGYEQGAFTGAARAKPGKFEQADKGTLFLDEIGEMSPLLQAKLLHVLQDGEFSRLGARGPTHVNVRVLAATNRKLQEAVAKREFRADLYFRLNVITLDIPPLRERRGDILPLCKYFLNKYRHQYGASTQALPKEFLEACIWYDWPGNVRQLENTVKRQLILPDGDVISELRGAMGETVAGNVPSLLEIGARAAEQAEKIAVMAVLTETGWNRKESARRLHLSYKALLNRIKRWQLSGEFTDR
jgi:two-component system, NtrC family, response regulator AtoC